MSVYEFPYGSATTGTDGLQGQSGGNEHGGSWKHQAGNDNVVRLDSIEHGSLFRGEGEAEQSVSQILDAGKVRDEYIRHDGRLGQVHFESKHGFPQCDEGQGARACTDAATREFQSLNISGCNGFRNVEIPHSPALASQAAAKAGDSVPPLSSATFLIPYGQYRRLPACVADPDGEFERAYLDAAGLVK